MKKENLIQYIEESAPLLNQAMWDSSGIQIDTLKNEFSHLAVMLDPTWENIEKAFNHGADCILAHHPLSMEPYRLNSCSALFRAVQLIFSKQALLYSAHTSLDATFGGFSSWLADDLALIHQEVLDEEGNFGVVGTLEKPLYLSDIVSQLEKSMPFVTRKDFRISGKEQDRLIEKVAFCFGSGSSLYSLAKNKGADIFITGDVKYHLALDICHEFEASSLSEHSENSIQNKKSPLLLDVGHFSLEEEMMRRFSIHLKQILPIDVTFIQGTNPFCSVE